MERAEVVRMAIDAGLTCYGGSQQSSGHHNWHAYTPHIERFASLVAAAERERAAKVCETFKTGEPDYIDDDWADMCAAAIRALD